MLWREWGVRGLRETSVHRTISPHVVPVRYFFIEQALKCQMIFKEDQLHGCSIRKSNCSPEGGCSKEGMTGKNRTFGACSSLREDRLKRLARIGAQRGAFYSQRAQQRQKSYTHSAETLEVILVRVSQVTSHRTESCGMFQRQREEGSVVRHVWEAPLASLIWACVVHFNILRDPIRLAIQELVSLG